MVVPPRHTTCPAHHRSRSDGQPVKRGDSVRFKTVGAGVASSRRGVVVRTVDSGRGVRVEVKDKEGRVFRPHLSTVKLAR